MPKYIKTKLQTIEDNQIYYLSLHPPEYSMD